MSEHTLESQRRQRAPWSVMAILFVVSSVVFIVFRSGDYNGDMPWQSRMAEGLLSLKFPPDHLFYGAMVRGIYEVWHGIGLPGRAHIALQTVNAFFGGVMVVTMFLLLLRVIGRRSLAVFGAVVFGLTPFVWHHATDVETYGASKAFQMLAVYFTFLLAEGGDSRRRYRLALTVAVFHALAAYMQYLHVMLVPAVIVAALLPREGVKLATRVKVAALYLVTVGVLVWGPFLYIAFAVEGVSGLVGLKEWLLAPDYGWPAFARMGWMKTPLKFAASVGSWPTPFGLPMHEAKRVLLGHTPLSQYLAAHWWRALIVIVLALWQVMLLSRFVVSGKRMWARWRGPIIVALAAAIFYQGFSLYWGGGFVGHAAVVYFLLMAMLFEEARRSSAEGRFSAAVAAATPWVCAAMALGAFFFSYVPEHNPKNNLALQEALEVSAKLSANDLMVSTGGCTTSEYWSYFAPDKNFFWLTAHKGSPGKTPDPLGKMLGEADEAIAKALAGGGRVFVHRIYSEKEDEITRPWNEFQRYSKIRRKDVVDHFKRYKYEEAFESYGHTYWRIVARPASLEGGAESE